jgi:hypothetical protein
MNLSELEDEFIGNSYACKELYKWLNNKLSDNKLTYESICILSGDSGIGKTRGVEALVKNLNKTLIKIDCNNCSNSKDLKDILIKSTSSNLLSQLENIKIERIILIDELEALLSFDRTIINVLCNLIDLKTIINMRIVITCNMSDIKSISKFKNINMVSVKDSDLLLYLRRKYSTISCDKLLNIVEKSQGNICSAITLIEGLFNSKKDNISNIDNLYNNLDIDNIFNILEQDPWLHPLRFHENLMNELNQRKGVIKVKEDTYIEIMKGLCDWDYMMTYNKGKDLTIPLMFISYIIQIIYKLPKKKNNDSNMNNFTRMFNYLSLKKKNSINMYSEEFPWQMIGNLHKINIEVNKKRKQKKFST